MKEQSRAGLAAAAPQQAHSCFSLPGTAGMAATYRKEAVYYPVIRLVTGEHPPCPGSLFPFQHPVSEAQLLRPFSPGVLPSDRE